MKIENKIKKQITESLNIDSFTEEQKDKIILRLMENISLATGIAVLENLSEMQKQELQKILDSKKVDKKMVLDFFVNNIENLQGIINKTAKETVDDFKRIRNKK